MHQFNPLIERAIGMAQGLDLHGKHAIYKRVSFHMVRAGLPEDTWQNFSKAMLEFARHYYEWDKRPPRWLHGGPAGLQDLGDLRPWPYVPSTRKSESENRRAAKGLSKPRKSPYVFFTPSRMLAEVYQARSNGVIYEVEPQGEIRVEPDMLTNAMIYRRDPELDWDDIQLYEYVLTGAPAFCSLSARIVRVFSTMPPPYATPDKPPAGLDGHPGDDC